MHESPRYGYLLVGDAVPTIKQLAMLVGETPSVVQSCFDELRAAGVFSLDDNTPYSRRMVRDNAKADSDRENGLRGGNPDLNRKGNGYDKPPH
jgi:DNA-binding transcriptional regulator YhcF (GntR family)